MKHKQPENCAECGGTGKVAYCVRHPDAEHGHEDVELPCKICCLNEGPPAMTEKEALLGMAAAIAALSEESAKILKLIGRITDIVESLDERIAVLEEFKCRRPKY